MNICSYDRLLLSKDKEGREYCSRCCFHLGDPLPNGTIELAPTNLYNEFRPVEEIKKRTYGDSLLEQAMKKADEEYIKLHGEK